MLEYNATPNSAVFIRIVLQPSDTGLFPQAKIYSIDDPTGDAIATVNLAEIGNGLYGKKWTNPGQVQKYFTITTTYTNAGRTNEHPLVRRDSDSINIGFGTEGGGGSSIPLGGGKKTIKIERLSRDEINEIVKRLFAVISPMLEGVSKFDPSKDIVKTDIVIKPQKEVEPINLPHIPQMNEIASAIEGIITKHKVNHASDFMAIATAIKDSKIDLGPHSDKIITAIEENKLDLTEDFTDVHRRIVDNKVEVPDPIDTKPELKEIKDTVDGVIIDNLTEQTMRDIFFDIDNKVDSLIIFQKFQELSDEQKKRVFNVLANKDMELLEELSQFNQADMIVKKINKASNKKTMFDRLLAMGSINKSNIAIINRFLHVV